MAISSETRRAGPFTGDGAQRDFPFAFKVFSADQVKVVVSVDGVESALDSSAYAVTLESDQDGNPGGVVKLTAPLASGSVLAILSAVPMLQPMVLTNRGGFYPSTLNDSADRAVILSQQLSEKLDRAITVDATDMMSPSELKQKLLDAATDATIVAKGYAESAKASAEEAKGAELGSLAAESRVDDKAASLVKALEDKGAEQEKRVADEGAEQEKRVTDEGDKQVKRLQDEANNELVLRGTACGESAWVLDQDIAAGNAITIHDSLIYLVGRHHLRVSWNGLVLYPGVNFAEIGDPDTKSRAFALTFDAKEGDELDVWVGALGQGDVVDAIETASAAQSAVAELSRKVVYKNQASAEE
nr:MAG TPA: tail fiber protein [Bacteriophage sp.]